MSKTKSSWASTHSSKAVTDSDIDDLTSVFGELSNNDSRSKKDVIPEKEQARSEWNHETRAVVLNSRKITIPPPKRPMFFCKNPEVNNTFQKQTIRRLYFEERDVQIELANPPDPKDLINPADWIPKLDPDIQAKRDAFNAKWGAPNPEVVERREKARELRQKKSEAELAKRNNALRKAGWDV